MGILFRFDEAFCRSLCDSRFFGLKHVLPDCRGHISQYE